MMRFNQLWSSDIFVILGKDTLRTTDVHGEIFQVKSIPNNTPKKPTVLFSVCNLRDNKQHCKPPAVTQEENASPQKVTLPSANVCYSPAAIFMPKVWVLSTLPELA